MLGGIAVGIVLAHRGGLAVLESGAVDAYASDRVILIGLAATAKDPGQFAIAKPLLGSRVVLPTRPRVAVAAQPSQLAEAILGSSHEAAKVRAMLPDDEDDQRDLDGQRRAAGILQEVGRQREQRGRHDASH